ncbi:hypothetical protein J3A78_003856 [Streptomyces sp. PvR006]|uniref:hypothetical protein n=1 Tax=Streptomyces sp. PvR006 TaxID=2817860 RepID=UPI001AE1700B|nr:hypothetical protein [Streptomyces sp. PvR006]MBP2583378.1 hypothetical protein [Streptomyces sp. PvR006]
MSEYDDMTNADVLDPAELAESDRSDEYRLDAEDEARWAAEETAATAGPGDEEPWDGLADGEER